MVTIPNVGREPDSIQLTATVNEEADPALGFVTVNDVLEDPWGRFAMLRIEAEFEQSGDSPVLVELANDGVDMVCTRVVLGQSSGAEDGRFWWSAGYREGGTAGLAGSNWQWLTSVQGDANGRGRVSHDVRLPEAHQPPLPYNGSHYHRLTGDSSSTDTVKAYVAAYYEPLNVDVDSLELD